MSHRVNATATITAPLSSRAAADRSLEAPAPGHRAGTIRSRASNPTRAMERPSSEVWCQPAGAQKSRGRMFLSGLGPAPPGLPPHSGLGCKDPERIFNGAAAMKPWKASSATNEPRNAWPSLRLDPQWSGHGPVLPQRGLSAATKLEDWIDYAIRSDCAPFSLAQFDNLAQKTRLSRLVVQGTSRKPENRP